MNELETRYAQEVVRAAGRISARLGFVGAEATSAD